MSIKPNKTIFLKALHTCVSGRRRFVIRNITYLLLFVAAACIAFLLRFDFDVPPSQLTNLLVAMSIWLPAKSIAFRLAKLDRTSWRFVSLHDFRKLCWVSSAASLASAVIILSVVPWRFPHSLYAIDLMISLLLIGGAWLLVRTRFESRGGVRPESKNVFIYGAGSAGLILLREVLHNPALRYRVCGFIDDDENKRGVSLHGVPVVGSGRDLARLAPEREVDLILIAMPSASGPEMVKVLDWCTAAKLAFRTMPSLSEMVNGSPRPALRDVAVEDLLGRVPVRIEHELVGTRLKGKVVLVTGAAGSIGSELCRQIVRFQPSLLIGLDAAETPLFHIDQEMQRSQTGSPFRPLIGNIQNFDRLVEIFDRYKPQIVFHAAAYKHVPMMEANMFQAVENNVLGTYNVATAASQLGCCDFVMISSDKAVRPTSIMGLTKRIAELIVQSTSSYSGKFVSVRFGNVLGSNGSVVPIFREQIAAGRPITVTHAQMRRYFMTIPEAAQLVLQAFTMGKGREIFVLDMGTQVKIVDLAKSMILLSGLRPGIDVNIEFTGLRPGEKLFEEINGVDEEHLPTYHEKIRIFASTERIDNLDSWIAQVRRMCAARDLGLVILLKQLVNDYSPSALILQHLFDSNQNASRPADSDVRVGALAASAAGA
jgi:FlaA1/EpsC-like NDP-sugar epimerase